MKKMKKILAFVMAMAMVLGMSVTSLADDLADGATATGTNADKGKIVVHGIEEPNLTTVKAYPIMSAKYDKNNKFVGYDETYITKAQLDSNQLTSALLDNIYTAHVVNAQEGNKLPEIVLSYNDTTKTYEASNQAVGMYMVVIPSNDSVTYNKAVASIYYTNDGSDYIFNNADLTLSTKVAGSDTWVKKDVAVKVEKTVNGSAGNTANVGDVLEYEVSIPNVPNYTGKYPKLEVTDIMSSGLAYQNDAKIYVKGENGAEDTVILASENIITITPKTDNKTELKVNFVKTVGEGEDAVYTYLLKDYAGKEVVIKYTAKLTENAVRNGKNNGNEVELDYTRDSSKTYDDPDTTPENPPKDKTHTYTFDINGQGTAVDELTKSIITKYGEEVTTENVKKALAGATFTLYTNNGDNKVTQNQGEEEQAFRTRICQPERIYTNKKDDGSTAFGGTTVSDDNGQIALTGLAAGTYYLKETEPPTGYSVNNHVFKIEIIATPDAETGELKTWSIKIDDVETATFSVNNTSDEVTRTSVTEVAIQNMKLSSLPSTGGIGTTIFTIGGCAIMIVAAGLFFASRRKSTK